MAKAGEAGWGDAAAARPAGMVSGDAVLPSTSLLYSARAVKSAFCGLPPSPEDFAGEGRRCSMHRGEPTAWAGELCCSCCRRDAGRGVPNPATSALLLAAMPPMLRVSSTLRQGGEKGMGGGEVSKVGHADRQASGSCSSF